jgi:hypothetical protein
MIVRVQDENDELIEACENGDLEEVQRLVVVKGADVDAQDVSQSQSKSKAGSIDHWMGVFGYSF